MHCIFSSDGSDAEAVMMSQWFVSYWHLPYPSSYLYKHFAPGRHVILLPLLKAAYKIESSGKNMLTQQHSCLSKNSKMGAPEWKNAFNTFSHRIIISSWLFRLYNECLVCWWYIVVTHQILVVVIGHFHATAKLRRLCGRDSSFCGGYALTKAYSRSDRLHKSAIWAGP